MHLSKITTGRLWGLTISGFVTILISAQQPVFAQEPAAAKNLVRSPSFEQRSSDVASAWHSRVWNGKGDCIWAVEEPGRIDAHCVAIESSLGADAAWTTTVSIEPNTYYELSGWIKTKSIQGAVGALLNIQNMQHVRTSPVTATRNWTRVATVFHSGDVTEIEINALFGGWGSSTGKAWYDDVSLVKVKPACDQTHAIVAIDGNDVSAPYSRMIFGGFIEHFQSQVYGGLFDPSSPLADERGFRTDVIQAVKELKISVVRWPGGCFASGYHWRDGVGTTRSPKADPVWGVTDPNTFGTDEFVEWCRRVGAEPYICTNAGNGTPEEMRQWVEYCNAQDGEFAELRTANGHEKPLNVCYWSIGNENWGGHEIGAKTPEQWGPLVRESAELMLKVDPHIVLLAAATPNRSWTLPLLRTAGTKLDYVCIHEYWLGLWQQNKMPDYLSCIALSDGPEQTLGRVIEILDEAGCRGKTKIAFDEWNLRGWHHPGFPRKQPVSADDEAATELINKRADNDLAPQYTMADALFSASFLNACLRHSNDVQMTNIAPIVNTRGPIFVHPKGIVKRTTFHTLAMYASLLEGRIAKSETDSGQLVHGNRAVSIIDTIATVDDSGRQWAIAMTNRHPSKEVTCSLKLKGRVPDGEYSATILQGDSPDAYNDVEHPNRVIPRQMKMDVKNGEIILPPHSLTILRMPPVG